MRLAGAIVALVLLVAAAVAVYYARGEGDAEADGGEARAARVEGLPPCEVPVEILERVWRGYAPGRSGDVLTVEWDPNQFGGVRHSTPWAYTQEVPIVLYGPGYIRKGVKADHPVMLTDIAPTMAELLQYEGLVDPDGSPLQEALLPRERRNGVPRMIFVMLWDGGGDNALHRWPDAWPHLKELMASGTHYANATVGSSPSITPPAHANVGTGSFPKRHGVPDMSIRIEGEMQPAFGGINPGQLRLPTIADLWDRDNGNVPLVGLVAPYAYQVPMLGHGAYLEGADHDIAVLADTESAEDRTNESFYSMPDYLRNTDGLDEALETIDQRDGERDRLWMGNELVPDDFSLRYTPVWPLYETDRVVSILENEGFGEDDVADLFFMNSKAIDLAGHRWNLVEPELADVLEESDRQLAAVVEALDRLVGDREYVLIMTADHGITPYPTVTGGWPIAGDEVIADIDAEFDDTDNGRSLIMQNRGYQLFFDRREMRRNDVKPSDVSAFLRDYRIKDNASAGTSLEDFQDRLEERVFITALTPKELKGALQCARSKQEAP